MDKNLIKSYFKGCLTIPNLLSVIRIALIPVFAWLFLNNEKLIAVIILFISGLTDLFDGKIARRFNQISELGKMLDPLADKLTQIAIAIIMLVVFLGSDNATIRAAGWVFLIFLIKEALFIVGAVVMIALGIKPGAAEIYGKVATFVFYGVMIFILLFGPEVGVFCEYFAIPDILTVILVAISAICTLIAFAGYIPAICKQVKERFSKK